MSALAMQETPEFQDRYAETVIFRIFYHLDRSGLGRLTLRDLKRCALQLAKPSLVSFAPVSSLSILSAADETSSAVTVALLRVLIWHLSILEVQVLTSPCNACRGDLLAALRQLDEEEDVNKVLRYFSYEHFYVIYCKVRSAKLQGAVTVTAKCLASAWNTGCNHLLCVVLC